MLFLTVIHKPLNLRSNKIRVIIKKDAIVKNLIAWKNIVNAIKVVLHVQTYVHVKDARTVKTDSFIIMKKTKKKKLLA